MTPGLNYTTPQAEGSQINFFLRGVGLNDFTDSNENPVAVYVDDVYRGAMGGLSFQLFDIEPVSYTHLRAHATVLDNVCRLLLEKKKNDKYTKKKTKKKHQLYT